VVLDAREFDCRSNNGSKANPCLCADILGDWREEVLWRTRDRRELRIFTTTEPTDVRHPTLMHDPIYRLSVAWQNVGYNQPTQVGFYLGEGVSGDER
jgi:rhamnogalacturonan endolyase